MSREVPSGWRRSQLGDLIKLEYGKALAGAERRDGVVPVFGSSGIVGYHDKAAATGPSIVISRKGSLGGVFYVEGGFWPIDTTYFAVQREHFDWRWLTYLLKFASLERLNEATGVPGLNRDKAAKEKVFVPPLREQRRIAEILSSVDEAIVATRAVIEQTRKVKQGVLERLLTKGIGHTRFKQTEIGEIPEGWSLLELRHLLEGAQYGTSAPCGYEEAQYPVIRIPNVSGENVSFSDMKYTDLPPKEARRYLLNDGDILVIRTNGNPNFIGKMKIFKSNDRPLIFASYLIRLKSRKDVVIPEWIYAWSSMKISRDFLLKSAATSAGNYNINLESLKSLRLAVPPLSEQKVIMEVLSALDAELEIGAVNLDNAEQMKSALMSDLLTGRKRVADALLMAAE